MSNMKPADVLRKAKSLISDPNNWNRDGEYFKGSDESTGCMCAFGAIGMAQSLNVNDFEESPADIIILEALYLWKSHRRLISFNDTEASHPMMMQLFDLAIEIAEATP